MKQLSVASSRWGLLGSVALGKSNPQIAAPGESQLRRDSILYMGKVARKLLEDSDILDPIAGPVAYVLGIYISLVMWSFGLMWLVFALATILYSSPFPFNLGWWGFTFPLGVYAANTIELGIELDLMFFKVVGTVSKCPLA